MSNLIRREDSLFLRRHQEQPDYPRYAENLQPKNQLVSSFFWQGLLRRKWLVSGVAALALIVTGLINFSITPIYRSSVRIKIEPESARIFQRQEMLEASSSFLETEAYLETQCEVLRSDALSGRVVKALNLEEDPRWIRPDQDVLRRLMEVKASLIGTSGDDLDLTKKLVENLKVEPIGRSRIVEVSFHSPHPDLASSVVNALAEEFIQYNIESRYSTTSKAAGFINNQLGKLKTRIEESEKELVEYVRENGIVSINETDNVITQRLADLTKSRTEIETDLILKQAAYEEIQNTNSEMLPQKLKNGEISGLESLLHGLEQKLANLNSVHGARWPEVIQVRHEIAEVSEQLQQEKEFALEETVEQARLDYEVAQSTYKGLMQALEKQKALATQVNEATIQYSILRREVEANKEVYEGLIRRVKEAGVAAGLSSVNIQVVDFGKLPTSPYRPFTLLNLILGLIVGLMAGIGLAVFLEYTNKTLRTPDDLERQLALPCLGIIPTLPTRKQRQTLRGSSILEDLENSDRALEAYRSLRTSILISRGKDSPQTILVTSALPSEGKTTTSTKLGLVLAQTGQPTLILDLDLRRPEIYKHFGVSPDLGLSYIVRDRLPVAGEICETSFQNLYLLPGGRAIANASELIGSRWMYETLSLLKKHFRFIVIDSAPVLSFTDTTILAPSIDATILVVRGRTCYSGPKKAKEMLEAAGGQVRGAVINDINLKTVVDESHLLGYYPVQGYGYENSQGSGRTSQC